MASLQATADPRASARANRTNGEHLFNPAMIPQFREFLDRGEGEIPAYRRFVATPAQGRMR